MKPQSRRASDPLARQRQPSPESHLSREWMCTYGATALAGATLASSVLLTADSTSVYEGSSLPQVLMLLVAGLVASFGKILPLPQGPAARLPLILLSILLGWLVLSTVSATWLANGRTAWNGLWHVVALTVFGCLFSQLCRSPKVAGAAAQLLVIGAVMLSVHAVHQVAISLPQTRAQYARDPDQALRALGLDAPPGSALRAQYESRLYSTEPLATFALTNSLAVVLSAGLLFQGTLIVDSVRRRARNHLALTTSVTVWLLLMSVCLMTKSRTAVLSIAMVAILTTAFAWRLRNARGSDRPPARATRSWMAGVALASIGMFAALVALLSRDTLILSEAPKSVAFRLEYWQATSKMILDYPLTGVGLGNFQSYYPRYKLATASETIADPHNWLFDIAACGSLPVLALVLILLTMMLVRNSSLLRQHMHRSTSGVENDASTLNAGNAVEGELHRSGVANALWIGAGTGWLLTAALQWILQESIDLEAAGLGLIVGLVAWFLMRRAPEPPEAVVRGASLAAAVTMLVCLLASGSWQASGISLPLLAWLAVSSFGRGLGNEPQWNSEAIKRREDWRTAWQPALMALLLAGFIFQTWRPVNSSWTLEQQALAAMQRGDFRAARQYAAESQAADPIHPAPYRLMAQTLVYQAQREPPERFEAFCGQVEAAIADLLKCDPAANLNWNFAAESAMTLAAVAQRHRPAITTDRTAAGQAEAEQAESAAPIAPLARRMLERAAEYQQGAVERYPSSVALHAQLGVILALLNRSADAGQEMEKAFALSHATPHLDRKLDKQQIWLPATLAARFPASSIQRPASGSNLVLAEPLCQFLRNKQ